MRLRWASGVAGHRQTGQPIRLRGSCGGGPIPAPKSSAKAEEDGETVRFELPGDLATVEEGDLIALLRADDADLAQQGGQPDVQRTEASEEGTDSGSHGSQDRDSEWSTSRLVAPEFSDQDPLDHPTVLSEGPFVGLHDDPPERDHDGYDEVPGPPPPSLNKARKRKRSVPVVSPPGIHHQDTQLLALSEVQRAIAVPAGRPTQLMPTPVVAVPRTRPEPDRTVADMAVTSSLAGLALVVLVFLTGSAVLLLLFRDQLPF